MMALLAASATTTQTSASDSSMSIRQQAELVHRYALELGPVFRYSNAAGPSLFNLTQRFFQLNRVALTYLLFGCNVFALQTFLATRNVALWSAATLGRLAWSAWNSNASRRLRKKLEFEFFVLILGCGNGFCLLVFWPGWILIGLAYCFYLIWTWAG